MADGGPQKGTKALHSIKTSRQISSRTFTREWQTTELFSIKLATTTMPELYSQTQETVEALDLRFTREELNERVEGQISFIEQQVEHGGYDGALIALSGGIDSTTTAYLAVEALGADDVHGLLLPREVNKDENMNDAERVAEELDISYDIVRIDGIVEDAFDATGVDADDVEEHVGTTSARARMLVNYLVAGEKNKLVLGAANRAELSTGYLTKFGDGGVDCNPLGNLYKQQVRQVAAYLGVDEDIVQKTPTAEMANYGTDEEELGIDYDTLDAILALHVDGQVPASVTARLSDTSIETVEHVVQLYEQSQHKRTPPETPTLPTIRRNPNGANRNGAEWKDIATIPSTRA